MRHLKELRNPKNINIIDIKIPKSEEYIKNFLRIKITSEKEKIILKKLKKNFYAEIIVKYDFGICKYEGRIRQNGDWPDHIKIENGKLIRSLDVKLNNSSRYINLGDWITHFTFAELNGKSLSLKKYQS